MSTRKRSFFIGLTVVLLLIVPLGRSMMFTVNEREMAVVLQFGEPVGICTEPKLYFKIPFVQQVRRLPKTHQFWSEAGGEVLDDLPTADSKKIEVTPWAVWKITDPKRFVEVLQTVENAERLVKNVVRSAMRNAITSYDLVDAVRSTNRELTYSFAVEPEKMMPPADGDDSVAPSAEANVTEPPTAPLTPSPDPNRQITVGRKKIVAGIKETVQKELAETEDGEAEGEPLGRGIELVDVGISRIDFVPIVREAAFDRQIAFMESIASKHTNEGERRRKEILNRTEAEVQKILGEGSQQANTIKGQVDAEIIDAYAKAIRETGEFYNFIRTLEAYETALGSRTRLILTTDSELLRLLKQPPALPETSEEKE